VCVTINNNNSLNILCVFYFLKLFFYLIQRFFLAVGAVFVVGGERVLYITEGCYFLNYSQFNYVYLLSMLLLIIYVWDVYRIITSYLLYYAPKQWGI